MASNLYRNNMAYAYDEATRAVDTPWHKLGRAIPRGMNDVDTMIDAAGLDWPAEASRVYLDDGTEIPNARAILRRAGNGHDLAVFGIATTAYTILQNRDALESVASWVQDGRLLVETLGAFGQGERMWALMRLGDDLMVNGTDPIRTYVMLTNSHDGRSSAILRDTSTRIVCANTFAVAMREKATRSLALRHTASINDRIRDADRALGIISKGQHELVEALGRLADLRAGDGEFEQIADLVAPIPTGKDATDRQIKRAKDDRYGLYLTLTQSRTIDPAQRGTRYAIFNAVTEFIDHRQSRRGQDWDSTNGDWEERRALYSAEGAGADIRQAVFNKLVAMPAATVR